MIMFSLLFIEVWLLLALSGLGPMLLFAKRIAMTGIAPLAISCALGIALLGALATFVFYLEWPPVSVIQLGLCISLAGALVAARLNGQSLHVELWYLFVGARRDLALVFLGLLSIAAIFSAGYRDSFGQPLQLGIDEVGYSTTADFFARGGTKTTATKAILAETGQPTLEYALNGNITSLSFNTNVVSEFLLRAHRFAYPLCLAGIAKALRLDPLADYQYCIMAVPLLCATFLIAWFCSDILRFPRLLSHASALAYCLNCNQLAVLFEGQHAQIVVLPLFVLFFGIFYVQRCGPLSHAPQKSGGSTFALLAFVGAGIFALYSDSFIALGSFGAVLMILDAASLDKSAFLKTALAALSVILGMLCLGLYCFDWIGFMFRHLSNIGSGNGGFWQPHWAFPAEILGYTTIYNKVVASLVLRTSANLLLNVAISAMAILILFTSGFWRSRVEARFWLVPIIVCLAVFIRLRYLHHYINYQYFKMYSLLLAPLIILHFGSLFTWCARQTARFGWPREGAIAATCAAACIPIFVGLRDGQSFNTVSKRLSADVRELRSQSAGIGISKYAILCYPSGGLECAMLAAYIDYNWLNLSWADLKLAPHREMEVAVLLLESADFDIQKLADEGNILFEGQHIAVFRTGRTLSEFLAYDSTIVANLPTNDMTWPHLQGPVFTQFLSTYLASIKLKDGAKKAPAHRGPSFSIHLEEAFSHRVALYDSHATNPKISEYQEFIRTDNRPYNEVDIQCNILSYELHDWCDLFQTAMSNDGIRLEADSKGNLALVVGETAYFILSDFRPNKLYSLNFKIDPMGRMRFFVDGVNRLDQYYIRHYSIGDIAVGTGYNKSRPFDGVISDFLITCKSSRSHPGEPR